MTKKPERRGQCLCGAVSFSVKTENQNVGACHCSMCRRWGGGPLLAIECGSDVHFDSTGSIATFSSSDWAERGFCRNCGTHLFYRLKKEGRYAFAVGLFDDREEWIFAEQIFMDEKPAFYAFANKTKNLTGAEVFAQYPVASDQKQ